MDEVVFFWNGWEPILRILFVGTFTYIAILFLLRISGKRTLARMSGFDFVITIAMGAAFGRVLTAKTVSIAETITVFVLLTVLQYLFSFFTVRFKAFKNFVTMEPNILFYKNKFQEKNMKKVRVGKEELQDEARKKGISTMEEVEIIIFERDGSFSVLKKADNGEKSTYNDLLN